MAIVMHQELPGVTQAQADVLVGQLLGKLKSTPGFIAHASGPTANGYFVTEFWESQEAHDQWLRTQVLPVVQQAGVQLTVQPRITTAANIVTR